MADVTVSELAKSVGASVERILSQMKQAGLTHTSTDDMVSDEEKQTLLSFLKASHGESSDAPKKITLKRKTTTTLKSGSGGAKKTVNVEVRKKRTYVKRDAVEGDIQEEPLADEVPASEPENVEVTVAIEEPALIVEEEPEPIVEETPEPVVEIEPEPVVEAVQEKSQPTEPEAAESKPVQPKPTTTRLSFVDDVEMLRQRAAIARKKANADAEKQTALRIEEKKKAEEVKKATLAKKAVASKAVTGKSVENKTAEKPTTGAARAADKKPKHHRNADATAANVDSDGENSKHNKKAGKAVKKTDATKKVKTALDYADDAEEINEILHIGKRKLTSGRQKIRITNKHSFKKPTAKISYGVEIGEEISVADLAQQMNVKVGEVVKQLMKLGTMATINQLIDQETAELVVEELGHSSVRKSSNEVEEKLQESASLEEGTFVSRAPIVTVMGHVDHGKTSLLDYIRKAKVASGEAGGITQHIGAYRVKTKQGELAFLDTPGHAAFTAMRARGAQCTDIVILVVAADDGVMPQTEEAVQHARAAGVPLVVAINKMDKEGADPDRVKNELAAKEVIPEEWGGDTQFVPISAHTGDGIDALLEAVGLQAELLELTAPLDVAARGVVIESRMDKGRGAVTTVLVQAGELNRGEILLAGQSYGRVRAMTNELGQKVGTAGPSTPVEILGLDSPPSAGDEFLVVTDEKKAREVSQFRIEREREEKMSRQRASKLDNMFSGFGATEKKILPVVLKTDVRGSLEAISAALLDLGNDEVEVNIVGDGVGGITENDVNLALTSGAIVLGFNVRAGAATRRIAEQESVEIRYYSIIYQLIDEVKSALSGMLDPERIEEIVGIAEVRDVFRSPKFGQVAGCMVVEGTVHRNKPIRVLRENIVIFEGELESLRRFKDDVNDVRNGTECGIGVKNYDVKIGDQIEVFEVKEVARELA
ncbi:MAG: translation initiation factor IF-2 [Flavobacteriales bacterium]|jgi:translation initiation factor IF-2